MNNKNDVWGGVARTVALLSTLLAAAVLSACSPEKSAESAPAEPLPEPESPVVFDCKSNSDACQPVIDCVDSSRGCVPRSIEFSVEDCAAKDSKEACQNFAKRLKQVRLVGDSYNFVDSAVTSEKFDTTYLPVRLRQPWDLEFLPDKSMLITEREGGIVLIRDGRMRRIHKLEPLVSAESGLMGLAIDPQFASNGYIYVTYSHVFDTDPALPEVDHPHKKRILNRISRFTLVDDALRDETVLIDNIPGAAAHTGSRLAFGPDGYLYATTGDAFEGLRAQEPDFLAGKILRMNKDGSVPADNPFKNSYVYSLGHRNPQGLAWNPANGDLYACEHGSNRHDEINRILPGRNYGWELFQCDRKLKGNAPEGDYQNPEACFSAWTMGPSGMHFVDDPGSPWHGNLFVAGLRGKHLRRYVVDGEGRLDKGEIFFITAGTAADGSYQIVSRIRDVEYLDGSLYVIGDFDMLAKLTPAK